MEYILLPLLLLVFLGIPLLQIRKQNKRMQEIRAFQEALEIGRIVRTSSGVHGEVVSVNELTVVLEIAPSVQVTWDKAAVLEYVENNAPQINAEETEPEA